MTFALPASGFGARLLSWNRLRDRGFAAWEFLPGMRFGERAAWWRGGARGGPHEGLDVCWFRAGDGRRLSLGAGARVPIAWPGVVVSVVHDFLGTSVFVAHDARDGRGWRLHSAYGHLDPAPGLAPGGPLADGAAVGTVAPGRGGAAPPHLHLTLALVDPAGGPLDWGALQAPSGVRLLDPLQLLDGA